MTSCERSEFLTAGSAGLSRFLSSRLTWMGTNASEGPGVSVFRVSLEILDSRLIRNIDIDIPDFGFHKMLGSS
jgi:hypothetical protein